MNAKKYAVRGLIAVALNSFRGARPAQTVDAIAHPSSRISTVTPTDGQ